MHPSRGNKFESGRLGRRDWLLGLVGGVSGWMVVGGVGFDGGIASGEELGASAESLKFRVRSVVDLSGEVHLSAQNAASTRKDG